MICLLRNMMFLRAVLICGLLLACSKAAEAEGEILSYSRKSQPAVPPSVADPVQVDREVAPAGFQNAPSTETNSPVRNPRLLAPPSREQIASPTGTKPSLSKPRASAVGLPKIESFATAGAGLAIVVGLFLVCMWLLRRSGPKPTSVLPTDAVAVLGRVPLAARNFAHLLQVGNKLVLVAITPDGVSPITEVTDPVEVQRLLGLCLHNNKQSTTAEFHNVLEKLSKEPASGFLGNEVAASYASQGRA